MSSNKQHLRADLAEIEQFFDVFIEQADAAIGRTAANFARVVGAVDAIVFPCEVHRVGPKRVVWAWGHVFGPFWVAFQHVWRRAPIWANAQARDFGAACSCQLWAFWNRCWVEFVDGLVFGPEVQRTAEGVHEDHTVSGVRKVRTPIFVCEPRNVAFHCACFCV